MRPGLTAEEIWLLPATIDLVTAGRTLGIGRTKAYQLARAGGFPCRVLRVGHNYRVSTADLLTVLGLPAQHTPASVERPSGDGRPTHQEEG